MSWYRVGDYFMFMIIYLYLGMSGVGDCRQCLGGFYTAGSLEPTTLMPAGTTLEQESAQRDTTARWVRTCLIQSCLLSFQNCLTAIHYNDDNDNDINDNNNNYNNNDNNNDNISFY